MTSPSDTQLASDPVSARAGFPADRSNPATWALHLLAHGEISVGKAREWLRHYIQDGKQDPLPNIEALP